MNNFFSLEMTQTSELIEYKWNTELNNPVTRKLLNESHSKWLPNLCISIFEET